MKVTYGLLAERKEVAYDLLGRLKEIGAMLSTVGFGTSYSSICSPEHLPVALINLDRSLDVDA